MQPPFRDTRSPDLPQAATATLARLHARAWGVATGLLMALSFAAATLALVIRGGADMGRHLSLFSVFFPGYSVSLHGAAVGFVYVFVIGYALGRLTGTLYNLLARES